MDSTDSVPSERKSNSNFSKEKINAVVSLNKEIQQLTGQISKVENEIGAILDQLKQINDMFDKEEWSDVEKLKYVNIEGVHKEKSRLERREDQLRVKEEQLRTEKILYLKEKVAYTKEADVGESPRLIAERKTNRSFNARKRAFDKLGPEYVEEIQAKWNRLNTNYGSTEWEVGENIIMKLIRQQLSQSEIRAILPVGGSRIHRIKSSMNIETPKSKLASKEPKEVREAAI